MPVLVCFPTIVTNTMANATWKKGAFWPSCSDRNSSPRNDGEITEAEAIADWTRPDYYLLFHCLAFLTSYSDQALSRLCSPISISNQENASTDAPTG